MFLQLINQNYIKVAFIAAFFCLVCTGQVLAAMPEHIAVLPIEGDGKPEDLKELRVTFFNHIGSKNYRDMELEDIDSKLFLLEQKSGKKWREFTNKEIADELGVQGLIFLNVIGIEKMYAGFYGSLTVKLDVTFVEASTGRILWKKEEKVDRKAGGVPLSPWAAISTAVQSALVLRDSVKIELFDKLCRNIAKALPEPPNLAVVRPPTIFSVVTNTLDSPFKAQDEILVSLKGDEGMKSYFSIVGQTDAISLNEIKPGLYLGKYVVTEGTNYKGALMEVFLVNSEKRKVTKYQVPYLVTVDTIPPSEPVNLQTGLSEKGFKLSWEKPEDNDIKEYIINKAVVGQAEFEELATTELSEYLDEGVSFGQKIFYRVYTKDFADNLSPAAEISRVAVKPGPTDVTGELKEDRIFYSLGSPYIVRGEFTVPNGIKLTIEAGSVIRFEDSASLKVLGSIESLGTKDAGVTFKGKGYNITLADTGAGGGLFTNTFFRNGGVFEVINSEARFEDTRFESFEVGLKSSQNSSVSIKKAVFGYNKTAFLATSGGFNFDNVEFAHNNEGMSVLADVSTLIGTIVMKNNILDITTETPLEIKKATVPDKESYEIIRSFRGSVKIDYVEPFKKSLSQLINASGNDLMTKIGDSLMSENFEDALKYIALLKELFPKRYEDIQAIDGYALFKTGMQKDARVLIEGSKAPYVKRLAGTLGLAEQSGAPTKVRFVRVKIPVFGNGEGIGKIAISKATKQSVKEHIKSVTGRLPRKKSYIVKDKIMSAADKYSAGAYAVTTKVSGAKFEGFYVVFLDTNLILADLQDLRIIGNKKREIKIGLASCGDGDIIRPELAKELNNLLFPLAELPAKGCGVTGYKEDIDINKPDVLVIVKEAASASKSRVSKNLKMINADMDVVIFDTKTGLQLFDASKGVVVYHMNESIGRKAAMRKAFESVKQNVLDKLVEIERKRAPKQAPQVASGNKKTASSSKAQPAKKAAKSKPDPNKGIVLSVAGVEPVFANMPNAFINRPFMTLIIENESTENISKSELTLDVPGYFPAPVSAELESIPASDRVRLQLFAEFTDNLKKISRTKRTDAVISIKYGKKETKIKYPIVIFDAHTTRWNNGEKIGLYIDEEDVGVKAIAEGLVAEVARMTDNAQLKKLYTGMATLDYLNGIGVKFQADAKRPFVSVYGSNTKVDTAKYPSELLASKSGDGDDILIAYGSILKATGVDMAFTVSDGKLVTLFDTSIPEELMKKLGFSKKQVVIYDENIWLPIDLTKLDAGSVTAWESGAKIASTIGEDTKLVVLSKALKKYQPARLFRQKSKVIPVSTFQAKYDELKTKFQK